jgi:hypothetical protein
VKRLLLAVAFLALAASVARADGVQPIVPPAGVLYGSAQHTITSSSTIVYVDTTTRILYALKGIHVSTITWLDGSTSTTAANGGGGSTPASWGSITGTLSSQTDLQTKLNAIGASTSTLNTSIGTLSTSTSTLQTEINGLGTSTQTIAATVATFSGSTNTLQNQLNALPTSYIQLTSALQSGATFYVSSGTVLGSFYASKIKPSTVNPLMIYDTLGNKEMEVDSQDITVTNQLTVGSQISVNLLNGPVNAMDVGGGLTAGYTNLAVPTIATTTIRSAGNFVADGQTPSTFASTVTAGNFIDNGLSVSSFVVANASKQLASFNLYGAANTWTGQNNFLSTLGTSFTYGVSVGSMTLGGPLGAVLATTAGGVVVSTIVPVASGGTGTGSPGLVAGTNVTITGAWPNQTVNSSGSGGGGGTSLAFFNGSTLISSPTISAGSDGTTIITTAVGSSSASFKVNPASGTLAGNTFNGASELVQLNASGNYPGLNGNLITNINAGNIQGTIPSSNLGSVIFNQATLQANSTFFVLAGSVVNQFTIGGSSDSIVFTPSTSGNTIDISTQATTIKANGNTLVNIYPPGTNLGPINGQSTPLIMVSSGNFSVGQGKLYFRDSGIGSNVGFHGPTTITTSANWALPVADSQGFWVSDGSQNLSISTSIPFATAFTSALGVSMSSAIFTGSGPLSFQNVFDPNSYKFVGSSGTPANGDAAVWSSTWGLVDAGFAPALVRSSPQFQVPFYSNAGNGNVLSSSQNLTNNGSTITVNGINSTVFTNVSTFTLAGVYVDFSQSTMTVAQEIILSTGTTPALTITANGTYGTVNGTSGGLLVNCTGGGSNGGYCSQFYTNAGAQANLGGVLNITVGNPAWNQPGLYVQNPTNTSNNNADILVDDNFTPAITWRETSQVNPSAKKWQISAHNGTTRFENRANNDGQFFPYLIVSSQTFWNDIYIGPTYGNQSNFAQVGIQVSTGNTYALTVTTTSANTSPYLLTVSTTPVLNSQALCLLNGELGHCTSVVGAGGACTCVAP